MTGYGWEDAPYWPSPLRCTGVCGARIDKIVGEALGRWVPSALSQRNRRLSGKCRTKSAVQRFFPTDRRRLERALSVAREARLYRRIEAVLLVAEGQPISEAARRVRATRLSVRGWVERYLATHDAAALADRPRPGRPHSAPQL